MVLKGEDMEEKMVKSMGTRMDVYAEILRELNYQQNQQNEKWAPFRRHIWSSGIKALVMLCSSGNTTVQ